jgi:hypothetical protein
MPRINLIGSSNLNTNRTNVLGGPKKSGLAPTTNMKPFFTSLPGYGVARIARNNEYNNLNEPSCGFNKLAYPDGKRCLDVIGSVVAPSQYRVGKKALS